MTIDRIAKLLQMAEGAKTAEEAAAFFAKAQALATAHEISLAEARQRQPAAKREQPVQQVLTVGRPRQQANRHYLRLIIALARSNGCEVGLYNNNTGAVLFGLPSDIATVERMFGAIAPQMIRLGEGHLAGGSWRSEQVVDLRTGTVRQVTRAGARASFYEGFTDTLGVRIREAALRAKQEAELAERSRAEHFHQEDGAVEDPQQEGKTGVALALRAKELEVKAFAARHLAGGTWRGGRSSSSIAEGSYRAGDRAAKHLRLGSRGALGGGPRALDS